MTKSSDWLQIPWGAAPGTEASALLDAELPDAGAGTVVVIGHSMGAPRQGWRDGAWEGLNMVESHFYILYKYN